MAPVRSLLTLRTRGRGSAPGARRAPTEGAGNRALLMPTLAGVARALRTKQTELRYQLAHEVWSATKLYGSGAVANVDARDLPILCDAVVTSYLDDRNRAVLAALCRGIEARTFFEIGTNRGRTAWTVAHNNPQLRLYTLDLPSPESDVALPLDKADLTFLAGWASGEAFLGTAEAERITALIGDSAAFDFAPYRGTIDLVYVDGAHSYEYVRNDTEAALGLLSPNGVIAWDDYPAISGVYRALNELAPTLSGCLFHILGTRLAVYSERELVVRSECARRGVYNVA